MKIITANERLSEKSGLGGADALILCRSARAPGGSAD
jgi:hypothetical protein